MAALLATRRLLAAAAFRPLSAAVSSTAVRYKEVETMPDSYEMTTGIERLELDQYLAGNFDPWGQNTFIKRGPGTKDKPCLVPSHVEKRLIACSCEEEQTHFNFMWVYKGDLARCECGYYYKLVDSKTLVYKGV